MNNVYWGIAVVIVSLVGYYFSWKQYKLEKYTIALALLLLCGLILRVYCAGDLYLHFWDERYHALVAKNLSHHLLRPTLYENPVLPFSYKSWEYNNIWVHKQPVTLWLMAASLKIFGIHAWATRVPSVIMSVLGIKFAYDIAARLYNRNTAYTAAFLFSIHGLIIELAAGRVATDHVDIAFMFFVLMAVWAGVKGLDSKFFRWTVLSGFCVGAAILCKWVPALIVLPVVLSLQLGAGWKLKGVVQHSLLLIGFAVLVAAPWQLYILHSYHQEAIWEYQFNIMHFKEVLADQGGNFFYHFNMLRMNYGELVYLPIIWFTYQLIIRRTWYDIGIATWFWVPYLFFSFSATKMQAYTLFAAPAVFIIIARSFYSLLEYAKDKSAYHWFIRVVAFGLVLLPIRYSIERIKPFTPTESEPAWLKAITVFQKTNLNNNKTVVFNCSHPIEMMFATDCICYPGPDAIPPPQVEIGLMKDPTGIVLLPGDEVLVHLRSLGYTTLIEKDGKYSELN